MVALNAARRIVVKIGSALLVDREDGCLRQQWLNALAEDLAQLHGQGTDIVVVSSGSIALGREVLGLASQSELSLEKSQAAAAIGQIKLARAYEEALSPYDIKAAQILLTLDDSSDRRRYLNSRATLETLLSLRAIPIVNENDTIATDEIRYGDNDRMAAQIAVTVGADLLVLLSDVDGLYTSNPQIDPSAKRLSEISEITPEIEAMAGDAGTALSKGGMRTKLMAAKIAMAGGSAMVIAHGGKDHALSRLARHDAPASWFRPSEDPRTARKRWILAMKPKGSVEIDAGAMRAIQHGRSLLPAGVTLVHGSFGRGDPVALYGPEGESLGQGLSRYTAAEIRAIQGCRSDEIEARLGYPGRAALIHRDDFAY